MGRIRSKSTGLLFAALLLCGVAPAAAQGDGNVSLTNQELLEILRTAKPAPTTVPKNRSQRPDRLKERASGIDLITRKTFDDLVVPRRKGSLGRDAQDLGAGPPRLQGGGAADAPSAEQERAASRDTTPTKPSPVTEVLGFPFNSVVKLLMRFNVGGTNWYWLCSASTRGSFILLSAGHCIYNYDPNDDGNTSDRAYANEVWAWPAQTDRVAPFNVPDFPYGVAKATWLRSYTGWTQDADFDWDFSLITLDRRIGDRTGWMGAESGVEANSLNFDGYPTETPYVPAGELRQYPGFDANNVDEYDDLYFYLDAYVYGGHSGGPTWRYNASEGSRNVQGINSTSDRVGSAGMKRITSANIDYIVASRNDDQTNRPPVARPNLIEYVWATDAKDLLTNVAEQGQPITVEYNVFNAGFANSGNINVNFYLSTDQNITTADTFIGTIARSPLDANTFLNTTGSVNIPSSQPVGNYYVGWIMTAGVAEYNTDDNAVVISNEQVQVKQKLQAPGAVALKSPKGKIDDTTPTYKWSPAARATNYQLIVKKAGGDIVTTSNFTSAQLGCANETGTCKADAPSKLKDKKEYAWAVKPSNSAGAGPQSSFEKFEIKKKARVVAGQ